MSTQMLSALRLREISTPPGMIWRGAGEPGPGYDTEPIPNASSSSSRGPVCATCAASLVGDCVPIGAVVSDTFADRSEFLRFGTHLCDACAWLYSNAKQNQRNVLTIGTPGKEQTVWPMISPDSATDARPTWLSLLRRVADEYPPHTLACGLLTTDSKPRNWPRIRPAAVGSFGLFVHAPAYDLSSFVSLDLSRLLNAADTISEALALGFAKKSAFHTLMRDHARFVKNREVAHPLEQKLRSIRDTPEFIPAVVIAHAPPSDANTTKGASNDAEKRDDGRSVERPGDRGSRAAGGTLRRGETRHAASENHPRLF